MTATKNQQKGYWEIQFYYKDWTGTRRKKHKRGFKTKREAIEWAEDFKQKQSQSMEMLLKNFVEVYFEDMENRLRESTIKNKRYIIELKILPYFGDKKVSEITASDIRKWQNTLLKEGYAPTYLKTINNQLSAIMNYAVQYYNLPSNPCKQAGSMGKSKAEEMDFWTKEEFQSFVVCVKDKPHIYMAFMLLYWTGMRTGELLALTGNDIDFENKVISITKSYQRLDSKDIISEPKTAKGRRKITLPDFLVEELDEYVQKLYGYMPTDRIFHFTKHNLVHEMKRGVKLSGVKKIRLHDLRHSHASLLISELGMPPLLVAERLGHEKIQTTLDTYSHLYPNQARDLADQLNSLYSKETEEKTTKTHKNPTISFRPSEWQKTEIDTRARLSGMMKNDFICRSCVNGKIVVVGKKETVQLIVDELQDMKNTLEEIAGQLLAGKMVLSKEEFSEMEKEYLALIITVVEIVNGAAYLFAEDKTKD